MIKSIFILLFIFVSILNATIINVPSDQPTIQAGIDSASTGDTVLVQPGTYFENIDFIGKNLVLGSLYLTTRDTAYIEQTIIDGNQNGSVVTFENGENSNTMLVGLTIQNGSGTYLGNGYFGGGIFCQNSSPVIRCNIISNNSADASLLTAPSSGLGGGIFAIMSSIIIEKNIINNNTALGLLAGFPSPLIWGLGGGIHVESNSTCIIDSNQIKENYVGGDGAGIYVEGDSVIISNNLIYNNDGGSVGGIAGRNIHYSLILNNIIRFNPNGGIYISDCPFLYIINNLISENTFGSGIWCINSTSIIVNNTIVNNEYIIHSWGGGIKFNNSKSEVINNIIAFNENKGIYVRDSLSNITVSYNNFWNHPDGNTNIITVGDSTWGNNNNGIPCDSFFNIFRNPHFENFPSDLHLNITSQCIDAGLPDTSGLFLPQFDLDGNPRIYGLTIDLGVYEYLSPNLIYDGNIINPGIFILYQNYPNPFNPTTKIKYKIHKLEKVKIEVFNLLGQKITTLLDKQIPAGNHEVIFTADNLPSGVYLYRIQAGQDREVRKMVFIK